MKTHPKTVDEMAKGILEKVRGFEMSDWVASSDKQYSFEIDLIKRGFSARDAEVEGLKTMIKLWEERNAENVAEIESLRAQLTEANEVIGFYADIKNWCLASYEYSEIRSDQSPVIENTDDENYSEPDNWHGGKRAREYLKKHGVK